MTLHELCEQAQNVMCGECGALPGRPCCRECGPGDYHPRRFSRARCEGAISFDDIAYIIRNFVRLVHDEEAVA